MLAMNERASAGRRALAFVLLAYCVYLSVLLALNRGGVLGPMLLLVGWSPIGLGAAFLVLIDQPKSPRIRLRYGLESAWGRWAVLSLLAVTWGGSSGPWVAIPLVVLVAASAYRGTSERSAALRRCVCASLGSVAAVLCIVYKERTGAGLSPLDYAFAGHTVLWLWVGACEYSEASALRRDGEPSSKVGKAR